MESLNETGLDLTTICVDIEELYDIVCEMKKAGEKAVTLQICEPMPDIELGKHITFEALGSAYGGATDYDCIEEITPEEYDAASWNNEHETDVPEGYEETGKIDILLV